MEQRVTVIAILCLGIIGSICSVVRIAYVNLLDVGFSIELLIKAPNFAILSVVELGVGISSICMATLRPLFQKFLGASQNGNSSAHYGRQSTAGAAAANTNRLSAQQKSRVATTNNEIDLELADIDELTTELEKGGQITVTTVIAHDFSTEASKRNSSASSRDLL